MMKTAHKGMVMQSTKTLFSQTDVITSRCARIWKAEPWELA